jgi:beta-mannosidase
MGTLYWQINDVWPVFSWASVDYYGQWKALHYRGRENYKDVVAVLAPLSDPNSGSFRVHAINEKLTDVKTTMVLDVMLFNGTQLGTFTFDQFVIPANSRRSQSVELLLPTPLNANTTYVRVSLWDYSTKSLIHSDNFFYVPPIYRTLPKPVLNITCVDAVKTCHFSTFNFAHYVYLELAESDDTTLRISNNFFDLTSGMPPVEVKILSNHTLGDISSKLQVSTLFDSYN